MGTSEGRGWIWITIMWLCGSKQVAVRGAVQEWVCGAVRALAALAPKRGG